MAKSIGHRWSRALALAALGAIGAGATAGQVPFGPQVVITGTFIDARTVIAADIDGDGDLDPIAASLGGNKVSWFENSGTVPPTFTERIITTNARDARECFAIDMDFDGDIDVVVASRQDNKVAWHENLGGGSAWTEHVVATNVFSSWSAWAADIDGDGDLDVLSAGRDDDLISWHENMNGAGTVWTRRIVYNDANRAQKAIAADLDGDGDLDILSASGADSKIAWHENLGGTPIAWANHVIVTNASNAKWVKVADINADGRLDVLSASEGNGQIRWYRNDGGSPLTFTQFLAGNISGAKVVEPIDFDSDGDIDLLSCGIGLDQIAYHQNLGGDPVQWATQIISTAADNPLTVYPADLDNDGDPDLLSASFMDNKVAWYENLTIHRSAAFNNIVTAFAAGSPSGTWDVAVEDIDLDGDLDLVSTHAFSDSIRWHENVGGAATNWTARQVTAFAPRARGVAVGDINRDGRPDIVGATETDNGVSYWRNEGGSPPTFTKVFVSAAVVGAREVAIADIDQDGYLDIVSCGRAGDIVAWHRNPGAVVGAWVQRVVTNMADGVECVAVGDVNGDGLPDIVSGWENADTVAWHRNMGGSPPTWMTEVIDADIDGPMGVALADVDRDGDVDVVSVAANTNMVQWHENLGGANPAWTTRTVATDVIGAQAVEAYDMDGDGDFDFVVAAASEDRVIWLENMGGSPPVFERRETAGAPDFVRSVVVADLNADGRADIASASRSDGNVGWIPNVGGQFALPTVADSPTTLGDGAAGALLTIDLAHRGRAGDGPIELTSLELLFETITSDPHPQPLALTSAQLNAIVDRLVVYLDEGSGSWDGADTPVTTVETFSLVGGVQTVAFADGDPLVQWMFGETPKLHVVVEIAANASVQSPRRFRVTHLTDASSSADDADFDIPLRIERRPNVGTDYITTGTACVGDSNGDGVVNFADLNNVLSTYNLTGGGLAGDVNGDGVVNFADLNLVLSNYNMECAP